MQPLRNLKVDKKNHEQAVLPSLYHQNDTMEDENTQTTTRPSIRSSAASIETMRATPPINIPNSSDPAIAGTPPEEGNTAYMDHYMRTRNPSISFSDEIRTDFGHRQSIDEPLPKPSRDTIRGRSILHELADERAKQQQQHRSNSESQRDRYDPVTGRHLPKYSTTPPREQPRIGEGRFPLLQTTVDAMARESQLKLDTQPISMTTQSTLSPRAQEVRTPIDDESQFPISPLPMSPPPFSTDLRNISTSLEGTAPRPFHRSASQRWRDGEAAQDFFSRAGSLRKGANSYKSSSRRGTASSRNASSSVASSFLRGFSLESGSGDGEASGPPAVDAEGQTIGEDYVLGKQIGYGGFSIIKEVTQISAETGKQRKLAVKIVRRNIEGKTEIENEAAQAEFDHEVELWRFLNHPNILPLEAVYKLDEATFCFIPLNTGGTLFDLIRSNRQGLPLTLAKTYAFQLASALRYLHLDARVVHRDVKLENCLIETTDDGPGLMRLCDFGMADWLDNDHEVHSPGSTSSGGERPPPKAIGPADTSTSAFAGGSLEYAPPEIVRVASTHSLSAQSGNTISRTESPTSLHRRNLSAAVDMWAYGVCLYTMITGKRPFSNSFAPRVVMAILAGDWDHDLLAEKAQGEDDLIDLVEGCLTMSERKRWDIRIVMDSPWFDDERERNGDNREGRREQWRL